jgi:hypothetical protein
MITPGILTGSAPSERTRSGKMAFFLVFFVALRRVLVKMSSDAAKFS